MAFLADRSIRRLRELGYLNLNPFSEPKLGPASYDIAVGDIYRINLNDGSVKLVRDRVVTDGYYFAASEENFSLSQERYDYFITTRSSLARCGLNVFDIEGGNVPLNLAVKFATDLFMSFGRNVDIESKTDLLNLQRLPYLDGRISLILHTSGTEIELPEGYPVCQLTIVEKETKALTVKELDVARKTGNIEVTDAYGSIAPIQLYPEYETGGFQLLFHDFVEEYVDTGVISPKLDISGRFQTRFLHRDFSLLPHHFYLGRTRETVRIENKYVGLLNSHKTTQNYSESISQDTLFNVHSNAPFIWPGSYGNQVLEIATMSRIPSTIKGLYACDLVVFPLDNEPESPYGSRKNDKYHGQESARPLSHLDFLS